jgi:2-polyprenyl-6-methoxyphenol hydroxylase-like FAD-dependent oxidoreductase
MTTEVLIVGAGPTGLVLALWLQRLGVSVRIIDKTAEPGTTSRALAVQARTLEFYRTMDLANEVVERGLDVAAVNFWANGKHVARGALSEIGRGLTPFPRVVIFPQDQHERLLIEHLRRAGVEVERRTELLGFDDRGDRVIVRLGRGDAQAPETCEVAYVAGCDGAHSIVRSALDIGFPGGTYDHVFYVADVLLRGPAAQGELHVAIDGADFLAIFPMKGERVARLLGTVQADSEEQRTKLTWNDVSRGAVERMKISVEEVHWFSTYRVHHRVAERFGSGRAFLLGDAAHVHSPVGGQGMNTGIGDAVNLAWKLAGVLRKRAGADLLETYEPERIAFARRLVATTDRAFTLTTRDDALARIVRLDIVPAIMPRLLDRRFFRRFLFRTISQTRVHYRDSAWSEGSAGSVHGGDRLPWVEPAAGANADADNHAPLASLAWQLHVYGEPPHALASACASRRLPLHAFPWVPAMRAAGLARNASYLVRPDGYVALADEKASVVTLEHYVDKHGLRFDL